MVRSVETPSHDGGAGMSSTMTLRDASWRASSGLTSFAFVGCRTTFSGPNSAQVIAAAPKPSRSTSWMTMVVPNGSSRVVFMGKRVDHIFSPGASPHSVGERERLVGLGLIDAKHPCEHVHPRPFARSGSGPVCALPRLPRHWPMARRSCALSSSSNPREGRGRCDAPRVAVERLPRPLASSNLKTADRRGSTGPSMSPRRTTRLRGPGTSSGRRRRRATRGPPSRSCPRRPRKRRDAGVATGPPRPACGGTAIRIASGRRGHSLEVETAAAGSAAEWGRP